MRKYAKVICILLTILVVAVGISACMQKGEDGLYILKAPKNVTLEGDTLTWDAVEYAQKYFISIGDKEYESKSTSFVLRADAVGEYEVKVRAYGDGETYGYGEWSESVTYVKTKRLAPPVVTLRDDIASWEAVDGAASYTVTVRDRSGKTVDSVVTEVLQYSFAAQPDKYKTPDLYTLTVVANPAENSSDVASAASADCVYAVTVQLQAPVIDKDSWAGGRVKWNVVDHATGYRIMVTKEGDSAYSRVFHSTASSYSVSALELEEGGTYYVQVQAVGDGQVYLDSEYTVINEFSQVYRLPELSKSNVSFAETTWEGVENSPKVWEMTLDLKAMRDANSELFDQIDRVVVTFSALKADGTTSMESLTKEFKAEEFTQENNYAVKYILDSLFYEYSDQDISKLQDDKYYGKYFDMKLQLVSDKSQIVNSDMYACEQGYQSYLPPTYDKQSDSYLIGSAGELAYIYANPNANYTFTANIDCAGYPFAMLPEFGGKINGNGFVIRNMVIRGSEAVDGKAATAWIAKLNQGALISDLHMENPSLHPTDGTIPTYLSALVGYNAGQISNCAVFGGSVDTMQYADKDAKHVYAQYAGGIAAYNAGTIEGCQSSASVEGVVAGGIVGYNAKDASVIGSGAMGSVTATNNAKDEEKSVTPETTALAGGLIGDNFGTVQYSYAVSDVRASVNAQADVLAAGGLIGRNAGVVYSAYAGKSFSASDKSPVTATASGTNGMAGGLIGMTDSGSDVRYVYSNVRVSGTVNAAGLIGWHRSGAVENAYSIGGTYKEGSNSAGFANVNGGTIANAYWFAGVEINNRPNANSDASGAQQIKQTEIQSLASKLAQGATDGNSLFGTMSTQVAPVLKNMVYLSGYTETIHVSTMIGIQGKYLDNNGQEQTIQGPASVQDMTKENVFRLPSSGVVDENENEVLITNFKGTYVAWIAYGGNIKTGGYLFITVV